MILSFKAQFRAKILAGTKTQTIREDKKNRWKPDMAIHFVVGLYTKSQETFKIGKVKAINEVVIANHPKKIKIRPIEGGDWIELQGEALQSFITADGFDSEADFWTWFNKPVFYGKVIRW